MTTKGTNIKVLESPGVSTGMEASDQHSTYSRGIAQSTSDP